VTYKCPKGHQSTDSDYCSECGALIGQSNISKVNQVQSSNSNKSSGNQEICPDCGTPRAFDARFCEVCRHDFHENKTGVAEAIVASQQTAKPVDSVPQGTVQPDMALNPLTAEASKIPQAAQPAQAAAEADAVPVKLNVIISVDKDKAASCGIETSIKPDSVDRVFPLDLDENLVGRRSTGKGIFPEIVVNDPGVSHRHMMFVKQPDNRFAVLELGSSNGTELNGVPLDPGVNTTVKAGDEFAIGIWTKLKLVSR
jgi:hypothetical protein